MAIALNNASVLPVSYTHLGMFVGSLAIRQCWSLRRQFGILCSARCEPMNYHLFLPVARLLFERSLRRVEHRGARSARHHPVFLPRGVCRGAGVVGRT